jgi:hypothetical protein
MTFRNVFVRSGKKDRFRRLWSASTAASSDVTWKVDLGIPQKKPPYVANKCPHYGIENGVFNLQMAMLLGNMMIIQWISI